MIIHTRNLLIAAVLFFLISGCVSDKYITPKTSPTSIYRISQEHLQKGNYKTAIKLLKTLNSNYPLNPYHQQSQLNMIYAYYKSNELTSAMKTINHFIRINPKDSNIDYVLYMRGLITQSLDKNTNSILEDFIGIDYSDRDSQYALRACKDFKELITYYPKSIYAKDASKRLIFLRERLAKHELAIIKYYSKRNAYIAVINRSEQMLKNYPDTQSTRNALKYMEIAYAKLGLIQERNKVLKLIAVNHN